MSYYKVAQFKATSGNECKLKIYPVQPDRRQPIDCSWETSASKRDVAECNQWFLDTNPHLDAVGSTVIEDEEIRQAVIKSYLAGSN